MFAHPFKPSRGGVEELTHQLAMQLVTVGHKVTIIAPWQPGAVEWDQSVPYKIRRVKLNLFNLYGRRLLGKRLLGWSLFLRWLWAERPDMVVVNSVSAWLNLVGPVLRILQVPHVVFLHDGHCIRYICTYPEAMQVVQDAASVVCNSHTTAAQATLPNIKPSNVRIIHPGVAANRFMTGHPEVVRQSLGIGNRRMVLTVGRLVERKGQDTVIRAMRRIQEEVPDVIYVIVGTGPHEGPLRELATKFGVPVIFCGQVSDNELVNYYYASDVFVMPSRQIGDDDFEGFGIVYLEAGACGIPVIAGRSGGVEDAVLDHVTGLLVDPMNETEVSTSVVRLLTDPSLARLLGENGRKRVEDAFDWPLIAAAHEAVYWQAIVKHHERQRAGISVRH